MSADYPTWATADGDIVITCPPCGLHRRYRDTVDDGFSARALWQIHANHQPDEDECPRTICETHRLEGEPWCSDCYEDAEAENRHDRDKDRA